MGSRLQPFPAALIARIPDPGRLCRDHRRNRLQRYAMWKLRVSAGCSHRAIRRIKNRRRSNRSRMKIPWQVMLHHAVVVQIEGSSYRLRQHAELMPELQSPHCSARIRSTSKAARAAAEKSSILPGIHVGISGEFTSASPSGENSRGIDTQIPYSANKAR